MAEIQFEVVTDLATVANTQIETNFEAVRDWLMEELAPYSTMVVTQDTISDAKKTRANIRKVGDSIDSQRKAVKKEWMRPYEEYEARCKELTGIVNEAVSNIDGQIKEMETAEKEAKRQRLKALFDEKSSDISEYVRFEDIFNSKWLNVTFSEIDAANSIAEQLDDIRDGLEAIRGMDSPYETAMLSEYSKSHNLSKALAEGKRLEAIQKSEDERRAKEEDRQQAVESQAQTETFTMTAEDYATLKPMVEFRPPEKTFAYEFSFPALTKAQMYALKECIDQYAIKYKARKINQEENR